MVSAPLVLVSIVELGSPGHTLHIKSNAPIAIHNNNIGPAAGLFIFESSIFISLDAFLYSLPARAEELNAQEYDE